MNDVQTLVLAALDDIEGADIWRAQLPAGFDNSTPTVVVHVSDDHHHLSGATRRALVELRLYAGSAYHADLASLYFAVLDRLSMLRSGGVSIAGEIRGQELPPEPETGWVSMIVRATARIKER